MTARAERIVDALLALDPLSDLPRTGWLLRGVRPCESLAEHSFGVAIATMLLVDALRDAGVAVDGELALRMALVHDAPEARTGDIPMPQKTDAIAAALHELERGIAAALLPPAPRAAWAALEDGEGIEARVVKAADKIQMMAKALTYERHGRGALAEFWLHPRNFDARGVDVAGEVFEVLSARAGRRVPREPAG